MWFHGWEDLVRIGVSAIAAYAAIVLILRISGKRSLAKLNIFDFVVTVALGSLLASIVLLKDISMSEGAMAFLALVLLQWLVTRLSLVSKWFRRLIRADARILLRDGQYLDRAMREERVTRDEVEAAIRKHGHGNVEDVTAVVLETDGSLSVIADGKAADCSALRALTRPGG